MTLFAWYNILFLIPLGLGLITIGGSILFAGHLGESGSDGAGDGHGVEHDAEHDAAHDTAGRSLTAGFLDLLGFGRAPVMILLVCMSLIFGGAGTISNMFLGSLLQSSGLFVLVSLAIAGVVTIPLTGLIARTMNRLLPTLETTSVKKADLIGCTGTLVLSADLSNGLAQITKQGDMFQIRCRSAEPLEKGTAILVTDYDVPQNQYIVCRNPLE